MLKDKFIKIKYITVLSLLMPYICFAMGDSRSRGIEEGLPLEEKARWKVMEILQNSSVDLQMDAVEVAAKSGDETLLSNVMPILNDERAPEPIKFACLMAIGDAKYSGGLKFAEKYKTNENPNLKMAAAYALIRLGRDSNSNCKIILEQLDSEDQKTKDNAVLLLGKAGQRKYIRVLRWLFNNEDSTERSKLLIVEALARLRDPEARSKAWALMISKRADDRVMGITSMQKLKTLKAKDAILTMLDDGVLEVRLVAAENAALLGDKSGKDIVVDFFDNKVNKLDKKDRDRALLHAIDAAIAIKDVDTASYVPDYLDYDSKKIQLKAAQAVLSM
ncbi:hypothetical protein L21SP3_00700 [Sedimentisphaera cyanobacteriorum]|uniref:HEAT repeat domain-containing protein n=1 Tax=Sedimentisphaera cyanobacteriorum TaxID=1940790 RepID=A0A1Q2HN44_9BACT|nr:hypothetical protein [Sedimentisphaera cyanobacteriorum]AQQ08907.1 hypothetical protein L21SP3_00700 [Sedimentisphaera cyanobacteriorum]